MTKLRLIEADVEAHGEVHATVAEHEKELEIRQGTATFAHGGNYIRIKENDKTIVVPAESIVSWYTPVEAWH